MQPLAKAVAGAGLRRRAWLDGEIVVLDADGMPDFNALQNAFDAARTGDIVYFLFDLPYFDGHDLRACRCASGARCCGSCVDEHGSETRALQRRLQRPTRRSMLQSALPR